MKIAEAFFPVVLFIVLRKMVLAFESVNKMVKCKHLN